MYREDSFQRIYNRIHNLKKQQNQTTDLLTYLELSNRIQNLKNFLLLTTNN